MSHNYVVFDNVVELNKDEDLEQPEPTTVALNDAANKNRASYIGNHRILWIKNKKIIFTLGPHWPFFMFMFSLLTGGGLATLIYIAPKYNISMFLLTIFIIMMELSVYLLTALQNPGIIPVEDNLDLDVPLKKLCSKCGAIQSNYSYHCLDCNVCIEGYDHHCVWTGKCIGKGNLAYFHVFLIWTALYLCYCIFLAVFVVH